MKSKSNIHDKFLKSILSDKRLSKDFFRNFLPENIKAIVDLDSLISIDKSFVDSELKEIFADALFLCKLKEKDNDFFISIIVEHKSYPDKFVNIQILRYLANGYSEQVKNGKEIKPILVFIYYHGKRKWVPKTIGELINDLPQELSEFVPHYNSIFIDLVRFSDEQLQNVGNVFLSSALTLQKYIHDPEQLIKNIELIFGTFFPEDYGNLLRTLIVYYLNTIQVDFVYLLEIIEKIPSPVKKEIMSTYELIEKQGIEKGFEQGIEKGVEKKTIEVIIRSYTKGLSYDLISDITGLSIEKVKDIIDDYK